jgi:hypothetical protein
MAHSPSVSPLGPEFDDFLFAPIAEEENGMLLNVVSALARLDLDPWQETANLARLPQKTAADRLAAFIVALPDWPSSQLDTKAIAAGLIARLPRQTGSYAQSAEGLTVLGISATMQPQTVFFFALVLMIVLGSLGFAASQRVAAHIENAPAPTASGIVPHSPTLAGGQ